MSKYVSLHQHSHYSLLDSTAKIEDLVIRAKELNHSTVALTDHGVCYGHIEAYEKCKKHGLKFAPGIETYFTDDHEEKVRKSRHLSILAKNNKGLENLYKMVTWSNVPVDRGGGFFYRPRISWKELEKYKEGLIISQGCMNSPVNHAFTHDGYEAGKEVAKHLVSIFGDKHYFVELQNVNDKNEIYIPEQKVILEYSRQLADELSLMSYCANDGHYINKEDCFSHEILKAIDARATLKTPILDHGKGVTKGRIVFSGFDYYVRSEEEMLEKFTEEEVSNTQKIADMIDVTIDTDMKMPKYKGLSDSECLEALKIVARKAWMAMGMHKYKNRNKYQERMQHELAEIEEANLQHYFMIVYDVCKFCDDNGIIRGLGRGSASSSLVLYLLGITRLADPIKYNLIWERFYNIGRKGSMPDIDLDIQIDRRDEVIEYLKEEFGKDRVLPMMTITTMTAKGVLKNVGKVFGLSHEYMNALTKHVITKNKGLRDAIDHSERLANAELGIDDDVFEWEEEARKSKDAKVVNKLRAQISDRKRKLTQTFKIAFKLEGVNRNRSTHACAILISDQSLFGKIPCAWDANKKTLLTGFDMYSIEKLGYMKLDVLGLKTLSVISRTVPDFINRIKEFDDPNVYKLISKGDNKGIFQLESKLGSSWCKKVRPSNIEDLSALISLIRPAVLETGLSQEYLNNKKSGQISSIHEDLTPIFAETYGICLYQEQVLELVKRFGQFDLKEADSLRKAIGKKLPELMATFKNKFIKGCNDKYGNQELADELWSWIEAGADYSFCKAHALTYAMTSYATAYAKLYHPLEFYCAMLQLSDNEQKPQEEIAEIFYDAKLRGIEVLPPSIKHSEEDFTISGKSIYFGLNSIKRVGKSSIKNIKKLHKECETTTDFIMGVSRLKKDVAEALCFSGSLDFLGVERTEIFAILHLIKNLTQKESGIFNAIVNGDGEYDMSTKKSTKIISLPKGNQIDNAYKLFKEYIKGQALEDKSITLKRTHKILNLYKENDRINNESIKLPMMAAKELVFLGVPIKYCEVDIYNHKHKTHSVINIKREIPSRRFSTIAVLSRVTAKQDKKGRQMAFVTLTDKTYGMDAIIFSEAFAKNKKNITVGNVVYIEGKISQDGSPLIDLVEGI